MSQSTNVGHDADNSQHGCECCDNEIELVAVPVDEWRYIDRDKDEAKLWKDGESERVSEA